jgi:hypothetical protein
MTLVLGIVAVVLVAASLIADYKWRQWMEARRREHHSPGAGGPFHHRDRP